MINNKVNLIIETLIDSTNNGNLSWIESGNPDRRDYHREFYALGEDGTRYETEVKFSLSTDGKWKIEMSPSLWIKSAKLPNGAFYVYGGSYDLVGLRDCIRDNYCSDMNPSEKIVEDILDSISKGISVSTFRDSKLGKILK